MAIRQGRVSSVDAARMTARVTFPDRDGVVSGDLRIITRGSGVNKDYWLPDVGEQVIVAMLDDGEGEGCLLGTYYSEAVPPENRDGNKRRILFSDGSYIEHNRSTGALNIVCTGDITINGRTINLN